MNMNRKQMLAISVASLTILSLTACNYAEVVSSNPTTPTLATVANTQELRNVFLTAFPNQADKITEVYCDYPAKRCDLASSIVDMRMQVDNEGYTITGSEQYYVICSSDSQCLTAYPHINWAVLASVQYENLASY